MCLDSTVNINTDEGSGDDTTMRTIGCRGDDVHYCSTGEQICADQWCDGTPDCSNGEDENNDQCPEERGKRIITNSTDLVKYLMCVCVCVLSFHKSVGLELDWQG